LFLAEQRRRQPGRHQKKNSDFKKRLIGGSGSPLDAVGIWGRLSSGLEDDGLVFHTVY